MIYKTSQRKLKIEEHKPHYNRGRIMLLRNGKQFLHHMWHPSCYYCK